MLFSSALFLFVVMPWSCLVVWLVPRFWRNSVLLGISMAFYGWGEPRFLPVVLVSAVADHLLARRIATAPPASARRWLGLGIVLNLAVLVYFKYTVFAAENLKLLLAPLGLDLPVPAILLPIGVSFITFEKISYLVDVKTGAAVPARRLRDYLLFVLLFPKLLAGPIIKYHDIASQFLVRDHGWTGRLRGFRRFLWGLVKKVLVADVVAELVDKAFALPLDQVTCRTAWLAMAGFTVQIYFDFSGYSDMAIGLARMMGFRLRENFDNPYAACSFTEFWRRWHISLGTWIREYLYLPLGGNRRGGLRTAANLWLCFTLSGLWHGASWQFVLWGAYNGVFLTLDRLFWLRWAERLPRLAASLITFGLIMLGWLLFRSASLTQFAAMVSALAAPGRGGTWLYLRPHQAVVMTAALGLTVLVTGRPRFRWLCFRLQALPAAMAGLDLALAVLGLGAIARTVTGSFNPFLYFRF